MGAARPPIVLELPAEPAAPAAVRGALVALAASCPTVRLAPDALNELSVAVQEACTNVIRHGYGVRPHARFRVELHRHDDRLEVLVIDDAAAYALSDRPPPLPEELSEGGYGVHIMRAWTDELALTREDGRNVLRLVRRYTAVVAGGHGV